MSDDLWKKSLYDLNVSRLYDEIKEAVKDFSKENIFDVLLSLMQFVEKYQLEGAQKKELVMSVLKKLCDEFKIDQALLVGVSVLIDKFVSIDNREIRIAGKKVCCF